MKKRLLEIKAELKKLRASIATAKDEELDGIEAEMNKLIAERDTLMKRQKMLDAAQRKALEEDDDEDENEDEQPEEEGTQTRSIYHMDDDGRQDANTRKAAEKAKVRAKMGEDWKKAGRTVVLDNSVLIPKPQSTVLAGYPFNQVSSVLDAVNYLPIPNGETYDEPYIKTTGVGDYTSQPSKDGTGGEYHEVGIEWDSVQIKKTKITAYSEISKELDIIPAANYADAVEGNITLSIRKKLAKEIIDGDGAEGHFVGIMSSAVKADMVTDYTLGAINENTLDELILNYGGEEDIESKMVLILNKLTLLAFSKVRGSDKRKVYTINYENKTIDGIKFFTTSHVKDFTSASVDDAVIAYGDLNKYRVAVFSNIETEKSIHYKFRQGITAFRGDVFMGGNLMGYKSFARVFKGASSVTQLTKKTSL
jgi:HK97 family phage major capsid protein